MSTVKSSNFDLKDYTVQGRARKSVWVGDKKTGRRVQLRAGDTVQLTKDEAELLGGT